MKPLSPASRIGGAALLLALFLANASCRIGSSEVDELFLYWRAFDDFAIAAGYAARGDFPVAPYRVRDKVRRERDPRFREYKARLLGGIAERQIRPHQFWRTIPPQDLSHDGEWRLARRFDDAGRALYLGWIFRLLGGAAPFLLFWLGVLACVPVLAWILYESNAAGHGLAGAVFVLACSCSAFVLDMLGLGYSTAGFHLIGLLVVVALGVHATLGRVSGHGLLLRAGLAAIVIGFSALARGTVVALGAGFALALGIGVLRLPAAAGARRITLPRLAAWLALTGGLFAPYAMLLEVDERIEAVTARRHRRELQPRYHDMALLVWKGLGDFDRTKDYRFRDHEGEVAIRRASPNSDASRDSEVLLREVILSDIRADPLWFAGILAKRVATTVTLFKLWPWRARDGASIFVLTSANEGVVDSYYGLTAQADWWTIGPWTRELPVFLLLTPTLLLLAAAVRPGSSQRVARLRREARQALPLLVCVAGAVLPIPVLITTATALESEAFLLVHLLAFAFLVEGLVRSRRPAPAG